MSDVLGAIMAGGLSTRYGSPKALAPLAGERVVDRVSRTLSSVSSDVVVIANDEVLAREIGLPWRRDRLPDLGPLGGFDAALAWAEERGQAGIFAAACDMPFLAPALFTHLRARAEVTGADAVVPESHGPRGAEPLAAYYSTSCIAAIATAAARGDNRLIGFHRHIRVDRIMLAEVMEFGDPELLFMNINTSEDRDRAEEILRST
jgi:molybdopterin-guanine dinucleotide biosynthesis protein A